MRLAHPFVVLVTVCGLALTSSTEAQPWQSYDTSEGEWRSYAGDIGGTKYSPLDQINATNFEKLEVAWSWDTVDRFISRTMDDGSEWWAPLDTIVESFVAENPTLYRRGQQPNASLPPLDAKPGAVGPSAAEPPPSAAPPAPRVRDSALARECSEQGTRQSQ